MHRLNRILGILALSAPLAVAGAGGCSSNGEKTSTEPTGAGSTGSGVTSGGSGGQGGSGGEAGAGGKGGSGGEGGQGGSAGGSACAPASGAVIAVDNLLLGDTNPDGTPNKTDGWKQYGFNIDGLVSTESSTDVCKPAAGGTPAKAHPDGDNGIDNSFGKNILPLLLAVDSMYPAKVNQTIDDGQFTLIAHLVDLGPEPDMASMVTKLYGGADLGAAPKFDGTDCWPVVQEFLLDPSDITSSKMVFDKSAVAQNAWSSGGTTTLTLTFPFAGSALTLTLYQARLTMTLDADHNGAKAGQLGGVVDREELAAGIKKAIGTINPSLCSGATIESIQDQIRQAADILKDGTQDPAAECDGISIGLGFTMRQVAFGQIAPPAQPTADPCPP